MSLDSGGAIAVIIEGGSLPPLRMVRRQIMTKPNDEELGPVFRAYGAACFSAQNLEGTLRFLLVLNAAHEKKRFTTDVIKLIESETAKNTLRELFDAASRSEYFTDIEKRTVQNAIKKRNSLIHSYWDSQITNLSSPDGRARVVDDLYRARDIIRKANSILTSLNDRYLAEYNLSTEKLKEKANEAWQGDTEE